MPHLQVVDDFAGAAFEGAVLRRAGLQPTVHGAEGQFTALGQPAVGAFDTQIAQNLALFDRAMKMFSPFTFAKPDETPPPAPKAEPAAAPAPADDALLQLRRQMEQMQAQIEKLAGGR